MLRHLIPMCLAAALVVPVAADEAKRIQFKPGESQAIVSGKITGRDSNLYKLNARDGQWLQVRILPGGKGADFNIFIPGRGPGEEALFNSLSGGREYTGQLYKSGDHSIDVFLNRAAARRGETADYKMLVRITDEKPVPQKVIDDCLATLRKQLTKKKMKVIKAERGENSFIIDVEVEGVPKPWRCFHDGTECTGTEYQGEG